MPDQQIKQASVYVVATPIGHLADWSLRAQQTIAEVAHVFAENPQHSLKLLRHYGIERACLAYRDENEVSMTQKALDFLAKGESVALISDAGTPLISDPGYRLLQAVQGRYPVVPVPGPSALIAALSVSAMPVHEFFFVGFLPAKSAKRLATLERCDALAVTFAFFESPHRLAACLEDLRSVVGGARQVTLLRELTKLHEQIITAPLDELLSHAVVDKAKGEFVLVVRGENRHAWPFPWAFAEALRDQVGIKQAASMLSQHFSLSKNAIYDKLSQVSTEG